MFKELHEQDQLEIRQLLGALEVQRAEAQKLASEANSARHALQVAERDREASAVAAAAAMAAARATGATGPSSRSRVEMASVGVQMDGDGDADVNSRVVGRGVAGGGGGGSGRPERGRVRLAGGPGGGALEEDGDSSASPPRALQALGSRRTRMWNTGGGSGSKASSVMGSPSGRKWSRPAYILFLPYHLHPGHPMWRWVQGGGNITNLTSAGRRAMVKRYSSPQPRMLDPQMLPLQQYCNKGSPTCKTAL